MPDRIAWSDLIPEVVFWPFCACAVKMMAQNLHKIAFLAKLSVTIYRFSTMPDRMAWSDLKPEVVFCPFCACAVQTGLKVPLK